MSYIKGIEDFKECFCFQPQDEILNTSYNKHWQYLHVCFSNGFFIFSKPWKLLVLGAIFLAQVAWVCLSKYDCAYLHMENHSSG